MYWALLIVCNIPVYLFIGWLLFDTGSNAADSFFDTIAEILKSIFIPRIVRVLSDDEEGGDGMFDVVIFFVAAIGVTWGEHWLLTNYVFE